MMLIRLAFRSLASRWLTVSLTVFAIALSIALFLAVDRVRTGARASFADTISNTDLIVGARSGSVQLLLYSVFRIGNATSNVTWESVDALSARPEVDWVVPLSLGDSHRQFRVMGTTREYFDRYRYRGGRALTLSDGELLGDLFDAVIGADVAATLGYRVGDPVVVAHGLASFTEHHDLPFRVSGILAKTGTPVDRSVVVSLEAIKAIHVDWQGGAPVPGVRTSADALREMNLRPEAVTAILVGVRSPLEIFQLQRWINSYPEEPLLAILPGVALQELWGVVGVAEQALTAVSATVIGTALLGMTAMILSGLNERRREMAILRSVGARPWTLVGLLMLEATVMAAMGAAAGVALLFLVLAFAQPVIDSAFGLYLPLEATFVRELSVSVLVVLAGAIASLVPALRAYRQSVADGMVVQT